MWLIELRVGVHNMEDSSLFMQWAIDTLLNEHPEPAIVGDGCSEATFPSLQALRDASPRRGIWSGY